MNLTLLSSNFCLFVCLLLFVSPECPPEMQAAMFCLFWPSSGGGRREGGFYPPSYCPDYT